MKRLISLLAALSLVIIVAIIIVIMFRPESSNRVVRLADVQLAIPQRYVDKDDGPLSYIRAIPGLDDSSREVLLTVPASEVASQIPQFMPRIGNYADDLRLRIVVLTNDEVKRHTSPDQFDELRTSAGSYRERVIEFDDNRKIVRVFRKVEYPNSWEAFRASRSEKALPQDLHSSWIGHCLRSKSPLTQTGELTLCKGYVIADNIAVYFTVSDENLPQIDAIRILLSRLVNQWRKK